MADYPLLLPLIPANAGTQILGRCACRLGSITFGQAISEDRRHLGHDLVQDGRGQGVDLPTLPLFVVERMWLIATDDARGLEAGDRDGEEA